MPLGCRIPDSLHAVSVSLPTMRDVIGYEERDPAVVSRLSSGYPRFVVHPLLQRARDLLRQRHGLEDRSLWLASSARAAGRLIQALPAGTPGRVIEEDGFAAVAFPASPEADTAAKLFLQHTGAAPSSRQAEDFLLQAGALGSPFPEAYFDGDSRAEITSRLAGAFGAPAPSVLLANSGMNAFYAAFRAVSDLQKARGRTLWIQLGWLYLDTICILKKFVADPSDYRQIDLFDESALRRLIEAEGPRIAGVVTEIPTNPLIQTPDLPALAETVRRAGAKLVLDPTLATPYNIDVLPHADVVVNSLTKFAASEGDVMAGAVVINPDRPDAGELRARIAEELEPVHRRDQDRLALEIAGFEPLVRKVNATAPLLVDYLLGRPEIRQVHWPLRPESRTNFLKIARTPESVGAMISFDLSLPLERFYDRVPLAKGPSFGMRRTLLCPFMYLAHYDMVSQPDGRAELRRHGIDPDLIRLSVGTEPIEDLIGAFDAAWG